MEKLIIVGTGGFGKEVAWLAQTIGTFEIVGFLDDAKDKNEIFYGYKILGKIEEASNFKEFSFAIAIGSPRTRKHIYNKLTDMKISNFPNLISPNAILSNTIQIGQGNIICSGATLTTDIQLGHFNIINLNSTVGHDCIFHNFITIAPIVAISGNTTLKELVEVGTGSSIRQGLTLAEGSMLGMGGVLTKNIENKNQIFIGNPAKYFKDL